MLLMTIGLEVGMALCHEFKGADLGLQLWDRWSQSDPRYRGLTISANVGQAFGRVQITP